MTVNRMLGIDFSMPVTINEWTLVVPLRKHSNLTLIFNVFNYEIWHILIGVTSTFIKILVWQTTSSLAKLSGVTWLVLQHAQQW